MEKQDSFLFLNSNSPVFKDHEANYNRLAAVGVKSSVKGSGESDFEKLRTFLDENKDWAFGWFTYELKDQIERLGSSNFDGIEMPVLYFFRPEFLFVEDENGLSVGYDDERNSEEDVNVVIRAVQETPNPVSHYKVPTIQSRVDKVDYIEAVRSIKEHIQYGDVYEMNYCIEHYAENVAIDPALVFKKLNQNNPAPFSCFCKCDGKYLISASPERFLKKTGSKVISQPMKGTIKRGADEAEDIELKTQLRVSEKERAENVMIVDLVRNDLSKTAKPKSVEVEELFGVYTFPQVHQMISTVKAQAKEDVHPVDIIKSAFPMGSMTGAPKVRAMQLIEEFEITKRGLFSGSVGYFTPEGDFDLNVVIRSIVFNSENKYLSFMTGGAITINSDPDKEYEECKLKAQALIEALS